VPIHDQSYRRYAGVRTPPGRSWTVIASAGIKAMLAKRKFLGLLIVAWLPFVVRAVQLYLAANFPQMSVISPSPGTFRQFLDQQGVFTFFITIFTGAGLISNDLRANALQIYLSKPVGRLEYVAGKFTVLAFFLLLVTWLPATLLLFVQVVFAGSVAFVAANLYLLPAILIATCVETTVVALVMLALSSLSKSARFVGVMYAGVFFFTAALHGVVQAATRESGFCWMSLRASLQNVGDLIFRVPPRSDTPAWGAALALAATVAASAWILERRVRGVEVVT